MNLFTMRERLSTLTVVKLKELLRAQGLPVSGKKAALIDRLLSAPPDAAVMPAAASPSSSSSSSSSSRTAPTRVDPAAVFARDPTPCARVGSSTPLLRIASWNVAGLRGLLKRDAGRSSLQSLADVDVLMLQETKLQTSHEEAVGAELVDILCEASDATSASSSSSSSSRAIQWYRAFASSTARKGYSGVCTLWNDRSLGAEAAAAAACMDFSVDPENEAEREGRTLRLDLPLSPAAIPLSLINVYTPNSGADLQRLEYRTGPDGWDERFRSAIGSLQGGAEAPGRHVCVLGDLNVAVEDEDFFNPGEARMAQQAGTTPAERASMRRYAGAPLQMVDSFRHLHPEAQGQFTYWSQRARNRPRNRGLRLDYALLSSALVSSGVLVDLQHRADLEGSDHCPIVLSLDLEKLRDGQPA